MASIPLGNVIDLYCFLHALRMLIRMQEELQSLPPHEARCKQAGYRRRVESVRRGLERMKTSQGPVHQREAWISELSEDEIVPSYSFVESRESIWAQTGIRTWFKLRLRKVSVTAEDVKEGRARTIIFTRPSHS